jgi:hypothetical protein
MISRRGLVAGTLAAGTIAAGTLLASPATACKAPRAKNREAYRNAIDRLFAAWWARDFAAFEQPFQHPARKDAFDTRSLFDAHFAERQRRFRGEILFYGASAIVQIVTPQEADPEHAICGGHAVADLFLLGFFPGLDVPVVEQARHVDADVLAAEEWEALPGALP